MSNDLTPSATPSTTTRTATSTCQHRGTNAIKRFCHNWWLGSLYLPVARFWCIICYNYWVSLVTIFFTNVAQLFSEFWAILKNIILGKTAIGTLGQLLYNSWLIFISTSGHTKSLINSFSLYLCSISYGKKVLHYLSVTGLKNDCRRRLRAGTLLHPTSSTTTTTRPTGRTSTADLSLLRPSSGTGNRRRRDRKWRNRKSRSHCSRRNLVTWRARPQRPAGTFTSLRRRSPCTVAASRLKNLKLLFSCLGTNYLLWYLPSQCPVIINPKRSSPVLEGRHCLLTQFGPVSWLVSLLQNIVENRSAFSHSCMYHEKILKYHRPGGF